MSYEDGMPAGGNSRFRGYPARMSERQQLALLLQMTSQELVSSGSSSHNPSTTSKASNLQQQRGSKGRYTSRNGESQAQSSTINRKEDYRVRQMLASGYEISSKENTDEILATSQSSELPTVTTSLSPIISTANAANPESPCSSAEISTTSTRPNEQDQQQHHRSHTHYQQQQQDTTVVSASTVASQIVEESGDTCEMRRTPPQNKVDRSGTGQSSSSPRVTLRINQVRGSRDEKKGGNNSSSRQGGINSQSQSQMELTSKSSSSVSAGLGSNSSNSNTTGNIQAPIDKTDVYEFKNTKEATPVRGTSSSPNPNPSMEKDKDTGKGSSHQIGNSGTQSSSGTGNTTGNVGSIGNNNSSAGNGNNHSTGGTSSICAGSGNASGNGNGSCDNNESSGSIAGSSANINNAGSGSGGSGSSKGNESRHDNEQEKEQETDKENDNDNGNEREQTHAHGHGHSYSHENDNPTDNINDTVRDNDDGNDDNENASENKNQKGKNENENETKNKKGNVDEANSSNNSSVSCVINNIISNSSSNNFNVSATSTPIATCDTTTIPSTATTSLNLDETAAISASPSSKRPYESDNLDEQEDESRRKKRKDSENTKEMTKTLATGRQSVNRTSTGVAEKCSKSGKQAAGSASNKNSQNVATASTDRKSPSASLMAGSPKPHSGPGSATASKTTTPVPMESDGEDERSKGSDAGTAPKVPPLKIVIPQSTASEQEQGNRNGKNTCNRNHQLPYVVASSSSSNDSNDNKEQNQSASGTTSPIESNAVSNTSKPDDKKDFSGALHGEERSTHHQRVLRSSHRVGNGNNGSLSTKESPASGGNINYTNSSPLYVPTSIANDRSNNSSPQQRHNSPTPEAIGTDMCKSSTNDNNPNTGNASQTSTVKEKTEKNSDLIAKSLKDGGGSENSENSSTPSASTVSNAAATTQPVELHPRKRKMKPSKESQAAATAAANEAAEAASIGPEVHPHDQPITNCYQLFLNIRKQIERRRKSLFPVQPKPPQGFKDYLMNRCTYVLAGNANKEPNVNPPVNLQGSMKELYVDQEKERYRLRMQHVVEKEKLVLSVEQEILRVHGRAARALANQSLPFSVCTILKDEEVYNVITPEQEEKDRNARSRYNGRLFLSWLQDVDDKWEKIKEAMLLRHHNEAESLHAVQKMDWEWKLKEVGLCEFKATPQVEDMHVPMVHVSDDFDLLPA